MQITWTEFKQRASEDLEAGGAYIYRGQRLASWRLTSNLHRTALVRSIPELKVYVDLMLPLVHDALESWLGRSWNLRDTFGLAQFLAFLQHNGFPTPLLDWTFSPYIAAYFAFESVNHFSPQRENVGIYSFNQKLWRDTYTQIYDVGNVTPHVSILRPKSVGNHKLTIQQGIFTWSNVPDIEEHIQLNEGSSGKSFLIKYEIEVSERPKVIRELSLMGITAIQLMPSVEAVCKKALEDIIGLHPLEPAQ